MEIQKEFISNPAKEYTKKRLNQLNEELKLNKGIFHIINLKTGRVWDITSDDVIHIDIFASASFIKLSTSGMLAHEGYHYAKIKTIRFGDYFNITTLSRSNGHSHKVSRC
ncbi:MAG: hypothetical protein ACQUHE_16280 [Bacteroidia bacterium]